MMLSKIKTCKVNAKLANHIQTAKSEHFPIINNWILENETFPCIWEFEDEYDIVSILEDSSINSNIIHYNIGDNYTIEEIKKFNQEFGSIQWVAKINDIIISVVDVNWPVNVKYILGKNKAKNRVTGKLKVYFNAEDLEQVKDIKQSLSKYRVVEIILPETRINIITKNDSGLDLQQFELKTPKVDLNLHYGPDFENKFKHWVKTLNSPTSKGISLLSGKPGTGKTTLCKFLLKKLKKDVIYVPPHIASVIADPDFIPFLMENQNSILFIEDAENVLRSREDNDNPAISNILNMSDGILASCLNIQIIATYNTDNNNLDSALFRKGRMSFFHHFDALPIQSAQQLSDSLNFKTTITSPMTLAEIYGQDSEDFNDYVNSSKKTSIGFKK